MPAHTAERQVESLTIRDPLPLLARARRMLQGVVLIAAARPTSRAANRVFRGDHTGGKRRWAKRAAPRLDAHTHRRVHSFTNRQCPQDPRARSGLRVGAREQVLAGATHRGGWLIRLLVDASFRLPSFQHGSNIHRVGCRATPALSLTKCLRLILHHVLTGVKQEPKKTWK